MPTPASPTDMPGWTSAAGGADIHYNSQLHQEYQTVTNPNISYPDLLQRLNQSSVTNCTMGLHDDFGAF